MRLKCPYQTSGSDPTETAHFIRKAGFFSRTSDGRKVQRFFCKRCHRYFSLATFDTRFRQKKRQKNFPVFKWMASGVSQRRMSRNLNLSRTTVKRKLVFLGMKSQKALDEVNRKWPLAQVVEFDDLETFEHTKLKPLSITLAVESKTRRILGFEVAQMPAKGRLAKRSIKKYGYRKDERPQARRRLFQKISPLLAERALIKSDENPHYINDVRTFFPKSVHERHPGQRGSLTGQGELKKIRFDPLFSLNHTCAMKRANINRLFRKTWCTTKLRERLEKHLAIYAVFHNLYLINSS